MKTIIVDGVEYSPVNKGTDDIRIVVHQRGHVLVGRYESDGKEVKLRDASVIRIWGTKSGLGEIAADKRQEVRRVRFAVDAQSSGNGSKLKGEVSP